LVTGPDGSPVAIHRTFLARNGSGKAAIELARATLGPVTGGAVRPGVVLAHLASCPNGQNLSPSEIGCTGARTLDFLKQCCIERIAGNCGVAMA
jgi:hypothetical protein